MAVWEHLSKAFRFVSPLGKVGIIKNDATGKPLGVN